MKILGGLATVSVDGVTITGNGTPGNPLIGAGGTPAGWPVTYFAPPAFGAPAGSNFANPLSTLSLTGIALPAAVRFGTFVLDIAVADAVALYDAGFYTAAGALAFHIGAQTMPATGIRSFAIVGGTRTLNPGRYYFATTGASITAGANYNSTANDCLMFLQTTGFGVSALGVLPATITPPADALVYGRQPIFALTA